MRRHLSTIGSGRTLPATGFPRVASGPWLPLLQADARGAAAPVDSAAPDSLDFPADLDRVFTAPTDGRLFGFLDVGADGRPITWRADRPIRVAANLAGAAYSQFGQDLLQALAKIGLASGFELQAVGVCDLTASEFRRQSPNPSADVLISWVPTWTGLDGGTADFIGTASNICASRANDRWIVQSDIRLRSDIDRPPGFVPGGWGPTLLHELLHCLGAGHCADREQVMHHENQQAADLGIGDRLALGRLSEAASARVGQ